MKKLFFAFVVGVSCCFFSCQPAGGMSATAKKNLEAAQAVAKMFESGDFSKAGDYIAADAVDHAGMNGDVKGLDSLKASFAQMTGMMSDIKNEIVKELADDEYTFQWMKQSSTMKVDAMGMKAGSKNTFDAIEVSKFRDGKIIEHWSFLSSTDLPKMMGAMSNMTMDTMHMKMDTTRH
jgi:predicted SnoaL-like aldol condensation-catalyzing enzyme